MKNDLIENLWKQKVNSFDISKSLNLDKDFVDNYIIDNFYICKGEVTTDMLKTALQKKKNGKSFIEIAKEQNIKCASTYSKYLHKLNIVYSRQKFNILGIKENTIKEIVYKFNHGVIVDDLIKEYGFNKPIIASIINNNGGCTMPISFDNTIFNNIDTEEKAYWLGFLYADGCVSSRDNGMELSLQLLDTMHLIKFSNFLNSKNKIHLDFSVGTYGRCRFNVSNNKFKNDLIKLGCCPQKSLILKFPTANQVPENFIIPFIRGYFDGDGCLSHTYSDTKKTRFTVNVGLIGTNNFLVELEKVLKKYNIQCNWYKNPSYKNNTIEIRFNKTNSVKFLNLIYKNSKIYLDRKYQKYLFFAKHKNFAVSVSDYRDYERVISEKAKLEINAHFNVDIDEQHANSEIIKKSKGFLTS